jgi:hypothetical protein
MTRRLNIARFDAYATPPLSADTDWYANAEDSVSFLKEIAVGDEAPIYVTGPNLLITGVLAPLNKVTPANQDDLLSLQRPRGRRILSAALGSCRSTSSRRRVSPLISITRASRIAA